MAYINEYVSKEKTRTFDLGYGRKKAPRKWTIDKEKDYIFFEDYTEIDEPVNEHFAFVYKNKVIRMVLNGSEFADSNTVIWKITAINIPSDFTREEVLSELREALTVYGCFGTPPSMEYGEKHERVITDF